MDFGLVLQTDPPASRVVELMRRAERNGFRYGWTFDSAVLWQEPFVIHSQILEHTTELHVGPMVTNPGTRAWEVTASTFATLNDMFGNRTVCGIGRGDSALRVVGRRPNTLARLAEAVDAIRDLAEGREAVVDGNPVRIPWVKDGRLPVWVAAYGPRALALAGRKADGFILQLADPFLTEWMVRAVRTAAREAGRDPDALTICVAAPAYVTADDSPGALAHAREQCRWFGGMVGNHVADLVARYGEHSALVPAELTAYIKDRHGYDYSHHGRAGNPSTDFVPDGIVDRFCLLGPAAAHVERLRALRDLGVDQFAVYAMHDARETTIDAYGAEVIPALTALDGRH
ncbi:TIGR03842 family LLM class F420-dependent oxidoreductase [Streptomyces sp. NPDC002490]|uniref:TIGR03842 family LLM class F420-dependent oxidoreductase n=1 Tax=Streptomyces sp. NPDC002490 TaxID=3154416 RepID=UPI00331B7A31